MKKILLLCICIACIYYISASFVPAKGNNTSSSPSSSSAWTILPQSKENWPKPLYITWQVQHLKESAQQKIGQQNWIPLKNMPKTLVQAIVAVEDRRFYEHSGIDIDGIVRATLVNIQADEVVQGASTITQQLIKNNILNSEQTMGRKISEAALALYIESQYNKDDILEMYLNTTYFGAGATGVKAAAATYFGMEPFQLSLAESATLAALPNAPSALNPYENLDGCTKRRNLVLSLMGKYGYLRQDEVTTAQQTPLKLAK